MKAVNNYCLYNYTISICSRLVTYIITLACPGFQLELENLPYLLERYFLHRSASGETVQAFIPNEILKIYSYMVKHNRHFPKENSVKANPFWS